MPRTDSKPARRQERPTLPFMETAREFYGSAFGRRRAASVEHARDDWADLAEEDRSFALGHLLYLNLMAESATVRLLLQVRDLLDEVAEGLTSDEDDEEPEELDEEPGIEPEPQPAALAEAVGGPAEEVEAEIPDGEDDDGEPDDGEEPEDEGRVA
ncbi:MAG: hypothetical protein ABIO70_29910 [Pseudomonadota bacterium]